MPAAPEVATFDSRGGGVGDVVDVRGKIDHSSGDLVGRILVPEEDGGPIAPRREGITERVVDVDLLLEVLRLAAAEGDAHWSLRAGNPATGVPGWSAGGRLGVVQADECGATQDAEGDCGRRGIGHDDGDLQDSRGLRARVDAGLVRQAAVGLEPEPGCVVRTIGPRCERHHRLVDEGAAE